MNTDTHTFTSLDEMMKHIAGVIAEAEAAERAQHDTETSPATGDVLEIDDFEIRRHVIRFVVDKIGFNSAEEFKQYVEFIYEFMVAASDE